MPNKRLIRRLLLVALGVVSSEAMAGEKLRLDGVELATSPTIRVFLTYVDRDGGVIAHKSKDNFKLLLDSGRQLPATSLQTFSQDQRPVEVVVVAELAAPMKEALAELKRGIRNLADGLPAKSKIALLGYAADRKQLTESLGPAADAASAANTMVIDEEGVELRLLDAVRAGIKLLDPRSRGAGAGDRNVRRLLIVVSDGNDVDADATAFSRLGEQAHDAGIIIETIGYAPYDPQPLKHLSSLARSSLGSDRFAKDAAHIAAQLNHVLDEINEQYIAKFEATCRDADGQEHALQAIVDSSGHATYSNEIIAKLKCLHPDPPSVPRWLLFSGVLAALLLVAMVCWVAIRGWRPTAQEHVRAVDDPAEGKQSARAAPLPEMANAELPAQPVSLPTLALSMDGAGRTPIVAWIVATNGIHVDQTFKLEPACTLIGSGPDCHVRVGDTTISSRHCEVRFVAGSFKLFDLGSMNGVRVNGKQSREHELVDNDVIRLGRTEFTFKSIS